MTHKYLLFLFIFYTLSLPAKAQTNDSKNIFESISTEIKSYRIDTSDLPDDRITRKIIALRSLKGGFNIDEAIAFKIAEDKIKGEQSAAKLQMLASYFTNGRGQQLLTNAVTWIYRREFSFKELKQLVRFYKTGAGQKLATRFPFVMLKSLAAAEILKGTVSH